MKIELIPVTDENREAILALSVRKDQPFVAPNDVSIAAGKALVDTARKIYSNAKE